MNQKARLRSGSSRRKFIKDASIGAAGFFIVPRHVLGKGYIAPSDKLNIGAIGVGGQGGRDIQGFAKSPRVNIVALADVDDRQSAKTRESFPKASYYHDFREMLDKEKNNIDACSVSTPDHMHAVATMAAMQLGKHVYTQKPLTHDIWEARMLTLAAKKYKVVTQMGNQGGSGKGVRRMKELYDAGLIGDVYKVESWTNRPVWPQGIAPLTGVYPIPPEFNWDLWLGTAPKMDYNPGYHPVNWRGWWRFGTGALGDMACHIMDPIYRILPIDFPESVECSVANSWSDFFKEVDSAESAPIASVIHLRYPRRDGKGKIKVSWYDGGIMPERPEQLQPGEPFGSPDGGVLFIGTKGMLLADCYGANPRLLPLSREEEAKTVPETIKRVTEGHYLQWVNACIAGYGNAETSSDFSYAGPFVESILIANLAIRSHGLKNPNAKGAEDRYPGRQRLLWDTENMRITNFEAANQFVKRQYRMPWSLNFG